MYTNQNRNPKNFKQDHLEMVKQIQINDLIHRDKDITVLRQKTKQLEYLFGDDEGRSPLIKK
jgi:hypothetical protein